MVSEPYWSSTTYSRTSPVSGPTLLSAGQGTGFQWKTCLCRDVDPRLVVDNAGKCPCIVRELVSCQIFVVFGWVRVSERACQRDHVRQIMSERACQRDRVRENVSERSCQREHVRENASERTCQRERVRENVSERTSQRDRVREHVRERVRECVRNSQSHVVRAGSVWRMSSPVLTGFV